MTASPSLAKAGQSLPSPLDQCIEFFWSTNPELKNFILHDLYNYGHVSVETNALGAKAVDVWLSATTKTEAVK